MNLALALAITPSWLCLSEEPACAVDSQVQAFYYLKAKDYPKALDCFNAALTEHPDSWAILQSIGNCQMELGRYDAAIASLQKSIEVGGLQASQCVNMAAVYQRKGDAKKALNWLRLACSQDPSKAFDPNIQAAMTKLLDPANNPRGLPTTPDYLSSLSSVQKWRKADMPIKVHVRKNIQLAAFYEEYISIIKRSLDQWCAATGGALSYKFVSRPDSANVICDYTDRRELVSSDHELGIEGNTEKRIRMEDNTTAWANLVILVKDFPGAPKFRDRIFITNTCLHELGHVLGMHGHSSNNRDVMFSAAIRKGSDLLTKRDKNTIQLMYR